MLGNFIVLTYVTYSFIYGSATGNAEHIAKDLGKSINEKLVSSSFTDATVLELNHFKRKKLFESWSTPPEDDTKYNKHALVVVCSTTGNGDAPENAGRFVRFIKKSPPTTLSNKPMEHVAYAVLGLGDTNYDQFCESGKVIDKKLHDWGGTRAKPVACADEATGLEETVEPWQDSVLGALEVACSSASTSASVADSNAGEVKMDEIKETQDATTTLPEQLNEKLVVAAKEAPDTKKKKIAKKTKTVSKIHQAPLPYHHYD